MIEGQQEPSELIKRTTDTARVLADMYENLIISRKANNQHHYGKSQDTTRDTKGKSPLARSAAVKTKLYRQLDELEQSANNDFERHRAQTLNMSFNDIHGAAKADIVDDTKIGSDRGSLMVDSRRGPTTTVANGHRNGNTSVNMDAGLKGLSDVSTHSDREILGDLLSADNNNSDSDRNGVSQDWWIPDQNMVDDKYSVSPLINHPSHHHRQRLGNSNRAISPGQYFGARSLPLDSFEDIWTKPPPKKNNADIIREDEENDDDESDKNHKKDPLESLFKTLPKKLKHRHQHRPDNRGYTIEPDRLVLSTATGKSSSLGRLCIRSTLDADQAFSLFSARGKLRFLPREGIVPALGRADVMVRLRKSAMHDFNKKGGSGSAGVGLDNILVLMKGRDTQQIQVDINDNINNSDSDDLAFEIVPDHHQLSQEEAEALAAEEDEDEDEQQHSLRRRQPEPSHKPSQQSYKEAGEELDGISQESSPRHRRKSKGLPACPFCAIEELANV